MNDYISKCRFSSPTFRHVASSFSVAAAAAEMSQGSTEGKTKTVKTQTLSLPSLWLRNPEKGQRKMEKERGGGENSVESPGAGSRSHTRGARQQTQFTKRHLFHYSDALWLITSWPVCEMTATYSPVNRKICTCSIWGVGEQESGGRGGWKGEQPGGTRKDMGKTKK